MRAVEAADAHALKVVPCIGQTRLTERAQVPDQPLVLLKMPTMLALAALGDPVKGCAPVTLDDVGARSYVGDVALDILRSRFVRVLQHDTTPLRSRAPDHGSRHS